MVRSSAKKIRGWVSYPTPSFFSPYEALSPALKLKLRQESVRTNAYNLLCNRMDF
jgi:hypothetical protein